MREDDRRRVGRAVGLDVDDASVRPGDRVLLVPVRSSRGSLLANPAAPGSPIAPAPPSTSPEASDRLLDRSTRPAVPQIRSVTAAMPGTRSVSLFQPGLPVESGAGHQSVGSARWLAWACSRAVILRCCRSLRVGWSRLGLERDCRGPARRRTSDRAGTSRPRGEPRPAEHRNQTTQDLKREHQHGGDFRGGSAMRSNSG